MRCGGSLQRPVPAYTLHTIDSDGNDLRAISSAEGFEWHPSVMQDGRILYSRWDYVDRDSLPFVSLWSTHPDGTDTRAVSATSRRTRWPCWRPAVSPARDRLSSPRLLNMRVRVAVSVLLDPRRGTDEPSAMLRLTPEVPWPESEAWPGSDHAAPYPLSEDFFLVVEQRALGDRVSATGIVGGQGQCPGLYLLDRFGNLQLLHRDPQFSSTDATPVRPRPRPPTVAAPWRRGQSDAGTVLLLDVYQGLGAVPNETVRRLRIVGVPPKTQPVMNFPPLGLTEEDAGDSCWAPCRSRRMVPPTFRCRPACRSFCRRWTSVAWPCKPCAARPMSKLGRR